MGSHELLELVAHCPPGAETLIMRMLHILAESGGLCSHYTRRVRGEEHSLSLEITHFIISHALPPPTSLSPTLSGAGAESERAVPEELL